MFSAEKYEELLIKAVESNDVISFKDAFVKLTQAPKNVANLLPSSLLIKSAEAAIKFKKLDDAEWCIKEYFLTTQSKDEFFCRAYLCQSQLYIPNTCKDVKSFELSVGCLLTAIQNAKIHESFYYLVYNASVLFWSFSRPFMIVGYRHLIIDSLEFIISSLNEINDTDFEWRSDLLILLLECIAEVGSKEELVSMGISTLQFIKQHMLNNSKDVLKILFDNVLDQSNVNDSMSDQSKISDIINYSQELKLYWKLLCIKRNSDMVLKYAEMKGIFACITNHVEFKLDSQRDPLISISSDGLTKFQRAELLTDLTRLSIDANCRDISEKCIKELSKLALIGSAHQLSLKILKIELKISMIKGDIYTKSNIKVRLDVIEELVEHITSGFQINDESMIQVGCVTLWNTCLPLLQNNLRHHIYKPLKIASQKLEEIDSLLVLTRIQMHIELAKSESEQLQKEAAMSQLLKASVLDVEHVYESQIDHLKQRLDVSIFLYQQPVSLEDQAASIIEKATSINVKNPTRMSAYLKKAGCLLSPDLFNLVIEGEKALINTEKKSPKFFSEKIEKYKQGIMAVDEHFQKIDVDSISIKRTYLVSGFVFRTYLWSDLVKIARKQGLWDITRASSTFFFFCYNKIFDANERSQDVKPKNALKRLASEIHYIYAECLVQLLKYEGTELLEIPTASKYKEVELLQMPHSPVREEILFVQAQPVQVSPILNSTLLGYDENKTSMTDKCNVDNQWSAYCKWLIEVSENALQHFLHSADIGVQLKEDWIVNNAAVYIWNYTIHLISKGQFSKLTKYFKPIFFAMQTIAKTAKPNQAILCSLGNALAQGLIQTYINSSIDSSKNDEKLANNKKVKKKSPTKIKKLDVKDDMPDLTEASSILENTLKYTSQHIVPLASRIELLKTWVLCKGLMNQSKNYLNFEKVEDVEVVLCHLEAMILHQNKVVNYSPTTSVNEVIDLAKSIKCNDFIILLEIWVKLAHLSFSNENTEKAIECCNCALELKTPDSKIKTQKQKLKNEKMLNRSYQLLHYANIIKGQCYTSNINRWFDTFNYALPCFVDACMHAKNGSLSNLAMNASKHYWNAIQPFLDSTVKIKVLQSSLKNLLDVIAFVLNMNIEGVKETQYAEKGKKTIMNEEDSKLVVALHDVLFRSYSDQKEFEDGVKMIENLLKVIKFSQHQTMLLKHKIIFLVRLNKSIESDMTKFYKPSDEFLSNIWFEVATYSVNCIDKLLAYKNSVNVLSNNNVYKKVCRLMDLASFLYTNNYPFETTMECLTHAMSFLLLKKLTPIDLSTLLELNGKIVKTIEETTTLICLLLMVADISTFNSNTFIECVNSALFLVKQLWKISYINVEKCMHIGCLPGEKLNPEKKEILSNTEIDPISFCTTIKEVSIYKLPEKHLQYYKADCNGLFISNNSITKPMQFFLYMEKLVNYLEINSLTHLTAHVLLVMGYLSEEILKNQILVTLVHLKCSVLYDTLEMFDAFNYHYNYALNTDIFSLTAQVQNQEELYSWNKNQKLLASSTKSHLPDSITFKVDCYIKIAELFIQLKNFSKALYLLQEAQTIARTVEYEEASAKIEYHLAFIFYNQRDLLKAMTLLSNPGFSSTDTWFKRALLIVDLAIDVSRTFCLSQKIPFCNKKNLVVKSKFYLKNVEEKIQKMESSLRAYDYNFMRARLTLKLGDILHCESIDCLDEQKVELLIQAHFKYQESLNALNQLGFKNESLQLQVLMMKLFQEIVEYNRHMKKEEYLDFYFRAKNIFEEIRNFAIAIGNFELDSILLPVHRYLFSSYSSLSSIMKFILAIAINESVQKRLVEEKKSAIDQVIDKYVDLQPEISQFEQLWYDTVQEIVATSVNISHSLLVSCEKLSYQYVETLGELGQLLNYVSKVKTANSFSSFEINKKKQRDISQYYSSLGFFVSTASQSMEYTMAAIYYGLEKGHIEIVKKTSFHLLESIGHRDSCVALQLLALHQSCCFSLYMRKVLKYVFDNATHSASALAFNIMEYSQKWFEEPPYGFINETNINNLNKYEWWQRLSVSKNHFQLLKEIPFKITYLILQHSPDYKYLYGGVFNGGTAGKKKDGLQETFTGFLSRNETSHELLNSMIEMSAEFTTFNIEFVKKYPNRHISPGVFLSEEVSNKKNLLEEQHRMLFENLIAVIEAYFGDILTQFEKFLSKEKETIIIILADKDLLQLPLEAMSVFSNQNIKSVTRDFSLQILYHRLNPRIPMNEKKTDAVKTVQDTKQKSKTSPATVKVSGTFRIEKENIALDPTVLKYLVDPFADTDIGLTDQTIKDSNHPEVVFKEIISEQKQKTSKWIGIKGSEKTANVKEIQMLLNTSFIFHGFGQFFSVVPPYYVAPLNLTNSYVAMLFDLAQGKRSTLVQQPFVGENFSGDLMVENPVITSAILSICGTATVILNQWTTSLDTNNKRLKVIVGGLLSSNSTVGELIRSLCLCKNVETNIENNIETEKSDNIYFENHERFNMVLYGLPNFLMGL
ncbi:cilia- and flagella-associated protein 46 isoform X1 [Hydra vulgaris]|uniref:cilia- and flagella-associated protein 46 isoform X1 n=1 Tax=Hydra vulgaris TaxID=6087 RepID=UPI0032EA6700